MGLGITLDMMETHLHDILQQVSLLEDTRRQTPRFAGPKVRLWCPITGDRWPVASSTFQHQTIALEVVAEQDGRDAEGCLGYRNYAAFVLGMVIQPYGYELWFRKSGIVLGVADAVRQVSQRYPDPALDAFMVEQLHQRSVQAVEQAIADRERVRNA